MAGDGPMRTKTTNNTSAMTTAAPTSSPDITKGLRNTSPVPHSQARAPAARSVRLDRLGCPGGSRLGGALWQEAGGKAETQPVPLPRWLGGGGPRTLSCSLRVFCPLSGMHYQNQLPDAKVSLSGASFRR